MCAVDRAPDARKPSSTVDTSSSICCLFLCWHPYVGVQATTYQGAVMRKWRNYITAKLTLVLAVARIITSVYLNPHGHGGGGVPTPRVFFKNSVKMAARCAAVFFFLLSLLYASLKCIFFTTFGKKNWLGHVRSRSCDVILGVMFGARAVICDVSCPFGLIFIANHSNHVRIFAC